MCGNWSRFQCHNVPTSGLAIRIVQRRVHGCSAIGPVDRIEPAAQFHAAECSANEGQSRVARVESGDEVVDASVPRQVA